MQTNKSKNLILILLFILLLINISMMITFFAFPAKKIDKEMRIEKSYKMEKGKMKCLMKDMALSKDQEDAFFKLRDEHKLKIHELFRSVKQTRDKMIDALSEISDISEDRAYGYAEVMGKLETQIQIETIDYFLKMKQLLDKEQFGKLIDNFRDVCGCDRHLKNHHHSKKSKVNDTCTREEM